MLNKRWHFHDPGNTPIVKIKFQYPESRNDGLLIPVDAHIGETILNVAKRYHIEVEGACEGVCACSTCHIILEDRIYDNIEEPSEDEEDMLDMAFGLTATSRLCCQVEVSEAMEGAVFNIPAATRNFYVDGHVPEGH